MLTQSSGSASEGRKLLNSEHILLWLGQLRTEWKDDSWAKRSGRWLTWLPQHRLGRCGFTEIAAVCSEKKQGMLVPTSVGLGPNPISAFITIDCCDLELKGTPNTCVLKAWSPKQQYSEMGLWRVNESRGLRSHQRINPFMDSQISILEGKVLFIKMSSLFAGNQKLNSFLLPHLPAMVSYLPTGSETMQPGVNKNWLETKKKIVLYIEISIWFSELKLQVLPNTWVLGIKPESSGRAANTLDYWASPDPCSPHLVF